MAELEDLIYHFSNDGLNINVEIRPLVKCKDCKHHDDEEIGMVYCPKQIGGWVKSDWFCADGVRKEKL